jgi:SAM-dependent methyltransferase
MTTYREYGYSSGREPWSAPYVMPLVWELCPSLGPGTRVLDVGCGNGFNAGAFLRRGCTVVGIDLSQEGVSIARQMQPLGRFEVTAADDRILESLGEGPFDVVVSTEVVEHLYDPRAYVRGCFAALKPGGRLICSTPYHGYLKNLTLAVLGKWDRHADPLWDGGHIKLWSRRTLSRLLAEAGFVNLQFRGAGRLPYLWKSMVMSGTHPADGVVPSIPR